MVNKQQFSNAFNQEIEMVRGDTLSFNFELTGLGSQEDYEDLIVLFSISDDYYKNPIIEVNRTNGISLLSYDSASDTALFAVNVAPEMTASEDLARYYYNLQIKDTENTLTLMRGHLTLLYEVTDKGV
jgi:hypothetical protein